MITQNDYNPFTWDIQSQTIWWWLNINDFNHAWVSQSLKTAIWSWNISLTSDQYLELLTLSYTKNSWLNYNWIVAKDIEANILPVNPDWTWYMTWKSAWLYLTHNHMWYWDWTQFKSIITNQWQFLFKWNDDNFISWDPTLITPKLVVRWDIYLPSWESVESAIAWIDTSWDWITSKPYFIDTSISPTWAWLKLTSSYMWYYSWSAWKTYMDWFWNFYLSWAWTNYLSWNWTTLNITWNIAWNKTWYADNTNWFWLWDDTWTYKLYIWNATTSMKWNGSALEINWKLTATAWSIINWTYITNWTITSAKTSIASINPTTWEINANKVWTLQIDTNAVTEDKILAGAITSAKTNLAAISSLTWNLNSSTVDTAQLVNNAVTSLKILDANITTAKIATGAITEATIATNAITNTKISDDAITTPKIFAWSITTAKIATNAITANEINAWAITTVKISAWAITSNELASNSVVAGKIAAWTIVAWDIATNAITAIKINAWAVTANKLTTYNFILSAWTFANNNPWAWSVSWTWCTVVYNWTEYSITNWNTSNKYIYWQLATPTVFATSVSLPAYWVNDFLVATNTSWSYILAWNSTTIDWGRITAWSVVASQLVAWTITANEIATWTITAVKMNVASLSAISADMWTITAGTITLPSWWHIKWWQTAYSTWTWFYLGNDSWTPKFSIWNTNNYMKWDWSNLSIKWWTASLEIKSLTAWENIDAWDTICIWVDWLAYRTNPSDLNKLNYVWFANASATTGNIVYIDTYWIYSWLSWLSPWFTYYFSQDLVTNYTLTHTSYNSWLADNNTALIFCYSYDYYYWFQTFTINQTTRLKDITVMLKKVWIWWSDITCYIRRTSWNTIVWKSLNVVTSANVSSSYTTHKFEFNFDVVLDNTWSSYYYISLESPSISTSNYYIWWFNDNASSYTWWYWWAYNSSRIQTSLTAWDKYFVINMWSVDPWAISTNNNPYSVAVWKAITPTTLQIDPNNYYYNIKYLRYYDVIATTRLLPWPITRETITYNHTLGKVPTKIKIKVFYLNTQYCESTSVLLPYWSWYDFWVYKVLRETKYTTWWNYNTSTGNSNVFPVIYIWMDTWQSSMWYISRTTTSTIDIYWDNSLNPPIYWNTVQIVFELEW